MQQISDELCSIGIESAKLLNLTRTMASECIELPDDRAMRLLVFDTIAYLPDIILDYATKLNNLIQQLQERVDSHE